MTRRRVEEGAGFRIELSPGTYTLAVQAGDAHCLSRTVDVRAATDTAVDVTCSVK